MKNQITTILASICLLSINACSQDEQPLLEQDFVEPTEENTNNASEPHQYGGWYCPDNLYGFPAVDFADWRNVPVVNGRLCTQEESRNGTSLIFIDTAEYPNAQPLDIGMPQLATYFNHSSQREEVIIVIQAVQVQKDSIVGFRYLNGGNGSARLHEIKFKSEQDIALNSQSRFVDLEIEIEANQEEIWTVMTDEKYLEKLRPIFDANEALKDDWRTTTNLNFAYSNAGNSTALFGDVHFGNYYVQNDFDKNLYSEKFMLSHTENGKTTLKINCGPFDNDFDTQKDVLNTWGKKVKDLAEE